MGMYLDYNASTPVDPRVLDVMIDVYRNHFGNASSRTHKFGLDASKIVEQARENVSALLGVQRNEVIFTSGSTESNNIAILGLEEKGRETGRMHIITTAMEHKSVLEPCRVLEKRGFEVEYLRPGEDGRIRVEDVQSHLREDTLLVSVMHVNNETGTIQPVKEIGEILKDSPVLFHMDASQSCGKMAEEIQGINFDFLSAAAHKMGGPQGIGVLAARNRDSSEKYCGLKPITYGGGQEQEMRPGTLPVALIAGMGKAAELAWKERKEIREGCRDNFNTFLQILKESSVRYWINGAPEYSSGSCLNVSFENYDSEALMLMLQELFGTAISNGSACTSGTYKASYVLEAMGLDKKRIESAVRISWGREKIDEEIFRGITEIVKGWQ